MKKIFKRVDDCLESLRLLNLECHDEISKIFDDEDKIHMCAGLDWIADSSKVHFDYWLNQRSVLAETIKEQD